MYEDMQIFRRFLTEFSTELNRTIPFMVCRNIDTDSIEMSADTAARGATLARGVRAEHNGLKVDGARVSFSV